MSGTEVSPVYYVLFRLLGYLVDHIDSLVDEWYPGLTCIDPLLGHELLQKFVPCTTCTGPWRVLSALSPAVCTCNGTSLKRLILCLILSLTVNLIPGCNGISNADSALQNKAKTMFRMKKSFAWLKMIKWIYIAGYFTQAGLVVFGLDKPDLLLYITFSAPAFFLSTFIPPPILSLVLLLTLSDLAPTYLSPFSLMQVTEWCVHVYIWCCEHARFCVEILINFHV